MPYPFPCDGSEGNFCPPISCVVVKDGVPHALIAGNWYALTTVTDEATVSALAALTVAPAADLNAAADELTYAEDVLKNIGDPVTTKDDIANAIADVASAEAQIEAAQETEKGS